MKRITAWTVQVHFNEGTETKALNFILLSEEMPNAVDVLGAAGFVLPNQSNFTIASISRSIPVVELAVGGQRHEA